MKRQLTLRLGKEEITVFAHREGNSIIIERDGETHSVQVLAESVVLPTEAQAPSPATSPKSSPAAPQAATPAPARPSPAPAAAPQASGPGTVSAPMVGVVKNVPVAVGDTVAAGDCVVILEAMKMDIDVVAHSAGTVAEVNVAPGQNVSDGQQLLRIDGDSGA